MTTTAIPGAPSLAWDPDLYDAAQSIRQGGDSEIELYRAIALRAQGPVLEACVGSGRVLVELFRAGIDAFGFDGSAAMVATTRERLRAAGATDADERVWVDDVTRFVSQRKAALGIIPYNSIAVVLDDDGFARMFCRLRDALSDGGALLFDVYLPDSSAPARQSGQARIVFRGQEADYKEESHFNATTGIHELVQQVTAGGRPVANQVTHLRYRSLDAIRAALTVAGFRLSVAPMDARGGPTRQDTRIAVIRAER